MSHNIQFQPSFYNELKKFNNLKPRNAGTIEKKMNVYDNASELYIEILEIYFDEYKTFLDVKKRVHPT